MPGAAPHHPVHPLRILFVCGGDFTGASEKQAVWFAEELLRRGHRVMISVMGDPATARAEGVDRVAGLRVHGHRFRGPRLRTADIDAARSFAPHIVHSFSPRLAMVAASREYARACDAALCVHWEDDEWSIREDPMRRPLMRRAARRMRSAVAAAILPAQGWFATPGVLRWVARYAAGHDALTPALAERVSARLGRPCSVVLPIAPPADRATATPAPALPARGEVLMYTGSIHPASEIDLQLALEATAQVQSRGFEVTFVHAGSILSRYHPDRFAARAGVAPDTAVFLGYLAYSAIPPLLESASILLQPGLPTDFNRLRLPSKLQAYLASGTPTVTFAAGFGELLADREEVLKTETGEASELADRIVELLESPELRQRLSAGGPAAARRLFDRRRNGDALERHYRAALSPPGGRSRAPAPAAGGDPTARPHPDRLPR